MGRAHRTVLILLLGLGATGAAAYPTPVDFDGSILRWHVSRGDPPITYEFKSDVEADAVEFAPAVEQATQLWSTIPGSYFSYGPVLEGVKAQVTLNLRSTLTGSDYSAGYAIFDEYDGKTPKHCSIFVVVDSGVSYNSMAKTFLHELGHCVGLGHTLIPQAIMSYSLEQNSFALDIDDESAVTRLYPADGSKPKLPPGCATGLPRDGSAAGRAALWAVLALPLVLVATRRRPSGHA